MWLYYTDREVDLFTRRCSIKITDIVVKNYDEELNLI